MNDATRNTKEDKPIILFDGVCNLCTRSVRFVLKRDPKGHFVFASIQSNKGSALYRSHGFQPEEIETFVLIERDRSFSRSDAAIRIAWKLSGLWPVLALLVMVPRPIRDWGYNVIARNRYRWFGKTETCLVPSGEYSGRFIE